MPADPRVLVVWLTAGAIACAGTRALIPLLRRAAILDRPNARSSHTAPTPRGGGIAVVAAIAAGWLALILAGIASRGFAAILAGGLLLAIVSWLDDRRGLSPLVRLAVQVVAVGLGVAAIDATGPAFRDSLPLPSPLALAGAALLWVWFTNLFNFMDGIDGLAGTEAAAIGIGLVLVAGVGVGSDAPLAALGGTVAAAAIGFLVWNWAPARIFLGDVGSVPLGYLMGFLLLRAAARGYWKAALILPLYFLADATITLARRLARGDKVWQAHREHFYQKAVQRGLGHAAIVRRAAMADALLIGCGWLAENGWGGGALAAAAVVVLVLLADLGGLRPSGGGSIPAAKSRIEEPPQ